MPTKSHKYFVSICFKIKCACSAKIYSESSMNSSSISPNEKPLLLLAAQIIDTIGKGWYLFSHFVFASITYLYNF